MARPYIASGKSGPSGVQVVAAAAVGAGLVIGLVEGFVSRWFSLLLIFPVVLGAVAGAAAATAVESRKVRKPLVAGLLGVLGATVATAAVHAMAYRDARARVAEVVSADPQAKDFIEEHGVGAAVDAAFSGEEHLPPLLGYLESAASAGVTISRGSHSSASSRPTITGLGVYVLWLLELLLACGIAAYMGWSEARTPFCESCEAWYDEGTALAEGAGDRQSIKATKLRLGSGQLAEAVRELGTSDRKTASVLVLKGCSNGCAMHEPMLELRSLAGLNTSKKQESTVYRSLITQSEAQAMRSALPATGDEDEHDAPRPMYGVPPM